jgi:radical SAM-linked protein
LQTLPHTPDKATGQVQEVTQRVALKLAIGGDLRYLSHRDTMRMLTRALVRAGLPVAYTGGFNPHIKLSMPLPRSVGMATDDDLVVVQLVERCPVERVSAALSRQLPAGARLVDVIALSSNARAQLLWVAYEVNLSDVPSSEMHSRIQSLLNTESTVIDRLNRHGQSKGRVDVRPYVRALQCAEHLLEMELLFLNGHSITPYDIMQALGLPVNKLRHRILRTKIEWQS